MRRALVLHVLAALTVGSTAAAQRYRDAEGRIRVALAQQPLLPNGRSVGPRTMAEGGIQQVLAGMGATVRVAEARLSADEETEYGGWKKFGVSLGHFADIVSQNERDGYFTVGLLATCPSMPGLVAGLQRSGPSGTARQLPDPAGQRRRPAQTVGCSLRPA